MGFGAVSQTFSFIPRDVPSKPPTPPRNIAALTTRTVLYIQYDFVAKDGGSAIIDYNIYIDDGKGGNFTGPYKNGHTLNIWNSNALNLTTGLKYRVKYSCTN